MNVEPVGDWAKQAACKGMETDLWFPLRNGGSGFALEICSTCPVRKECAEHAIPDPGLQGIWGGMMKEERDRERSRRAKRLRPARDVRPKPWMDQLPLSLEQAAARAALEYRS